MDEYFNLIVDRDNLTRSLYGHEFRAKNPAISIAGSARQGYHARLSM